LRAALTVDGKETTLATLHVGDFFGEVALLSEGPRAADILANEASVLLKLPAKGFATIISEAPALATPFLLAISRSITARLLDLDRKYVSSIRSARAGSEVHL
jgi:CRP-like cAMP-binding protein